MEITVSRHFLSWLHDAAISLAFKKAAAARRLIFTDHALDEMDAEGETRESVAAALEHAGSFTLQENGRWRVYGEGLTVIVQVDAPGGDCLDCVRGVI